MDITNIYSYLVHPSKGDERQPRVMGADIERSGAMYGMLLRLFETSDEDCDIDIVFKPSPEGQQKNERRSQILDLLKEPTLARGRILAEHLQAATTRRSGLGLLFLLIAQDGQRHKVVISRFPADNGILADENQDALQVRLVEKVFMRNAFAYKAVTYDGNSLDSDFWRGRAVDKQIKNSADRTSQYWINDFLLSTFATTPAAGSRRLAQCLRDAIRHTDSLDVRQELVAAAQLASGLEGQTTSIATFAEHFGLSDKAKHALTSRFRIALPVTELFQFDGTEFRKIVAYKSIELNTGAIMTAELNRFDECFQSESVVEAEEVEYRARGRIVSAHLRKTK